MLAHNGLTVMVYDVDLRDDDRHRINYDELLVDWTTRYPVSAAPYLHHNRDWPDDVKFTALRVQRRRNGETTVFGCFLKFEVAGSRQAFRAACFRFYQPAAAFRFRPKRPLQSEYFWDFWAFLQIGQLRCNKPPKPHPERYAPSYPGTAGRAEIRSAPEPWYGS